MSKPRTANPSTGAPAPRTAAQARALQQAAPQRREPGAEAAADAEATRVLGGLDPKVAG